MEGRGIFYWIGTVALSLQIGIKMNENMHTGEEGAKGTGIYTLLLIALGIMWVMSVGN